MGSSSSGEGWGRGLVLLAPCCCHFHASKEMLAQQRVLVGPGSGSVQTLAVTWAGTWLVAGRGIKGCRNVWNPHHFYLVQFLFSRLPALYFYLCLGSVFFCHIPWPHCR